MTARELRDKYLRFFESKGHRRHPSGSLIPYDVTGKLDESLLFNGAGMVQFKPYFRGAAKPPHRRLTNSQKCVRTGDIDEVGDTSHLTFFEMLGNFSFGDYFKAEAIAYSWEFLTSKEWLGLDPKRLSFTIFEEDDEAYTLWAEQIAKAGIDPATRIFRLNEETNYWPASAFSKGPPGPCGPNSEMFFWTPNDEPAPSGKYTREDYVRDEKAGKWLEIWNDVFIQFEWVGHYRNPERPSDGYEKDGLEPLPFRSVDTGMGLERTATVLAGHASVYDTDLFEPIIRHIEDVGRDAGSGARIDENGSESGWRASSRAASGSGSDHPHPTSKSDSPQATPLSDPPIKGKGSSDSSDKSDLSAPKPQTPNPKPLKYGDDPDKDRAIRIIADHIRTACFCIADGILPSNTGRGYVLRRLIRRAVLKGQRVLGFEKPFFHEVYEGVVGVMGDYFPELHERREIIVETLQNEEAQFRRTVAQGSEKLWEYCATAVFKLVYLSKKPLLAAQQRGYVELEPLLLAAFDLDYRKDDGTVARGDFSSLRRIKDAWQFAMKDVEAQLGNSEDRSQELGWPLMYSMPTLWTEAFPLYDTFGFPLEVTVELAEEAGVVVNVEKFYQDMREAQERSRGSDGMANVYAENENLVLSASSAANLQTEFVGYDTLTATANVGLVSPRFGKDGLTNGHFQIALDRTPFYAESGGQVGDTGVIACDEFEFKVTNTWKELGIVWHDVDLVRGPSLKGLSQEGVTRALEDGILFRQVEARVDAGKRKATTRNHTATHLLHAALRKVLGKHVTQAGSLVTPDHLRFDFTHGKAMSPKEIAEVEKIVNRGALEDHDVTVHSDLAIEEAKAKGAMALFGEKYGDRVRMIQVDEVSKELCGGCHVRRTGEIGLFKITGEASAASGVRRIEAVTGEVAYKWALDKDKAVREAADLLKSNPANLIQAVEKTLEQLKEEKKKREKAEHAMVRGASGSDRSDRSDKSDKSDTETVGPVQLWAKRYDSVDPKIVASAIDDAVASDPKLVAAAAIVNEGKVNLVCKVGPEAQASKAHAGNLVRELAKLVGGGGGGRPDFATAGGKDPSQVDAALAAAKDLLGKQVGG